MVHIKQRAIQSKDTQIGDEMTITQHVIQHMTEKQNRINRNIVIIANNAPMATVDVIPKRNIMHIHSIGFQRIPIGMPRNPKLQKPIFKRPILHIPIFSKVPMLQIPHASPIIAKL